MYKYILLRKELKKLGYIYINGFWEKHKTKNVFVRIFIKNERIETIYTHKKNDWFNKEYDKLKQNEYIKRYYKNEF